LENLISALIGCLLNKSDDLLESFYSFKSKGESALTTSQILILGIYYKDSLKMREEFLTTMVCLSSSILDGNQRPPIFYILEQLLANLPSSEKPETKENKHYFDLLCILVDEYFELQTKGHPKFEKIIDEGKLLKSLIEKFQSHKSSEQVGKDTEDKVLVGLLNFITKLVQKSENPKKTSDIMIKEFNLLNELFYRCLFPDDVKPYEGDIDETVDQSYISGAGEMKCRTKESRAAAYKLLWTICETPEVLSNFLQNCFGPLVDRIKKIKGWNYIPNGEKRSNGYLGLRNLGCICYMISMLQQFFMVPAFRFLLLKAEDTNPEDIVEYKGQMINDSLLYQLQKMFGHMEISER
jgi:ubiquitin carboxyl-terminal hydrolase 34